MADDLPINTKLNGGPLFAGPDPTPAPIERPGHEVAPPAEVQLVDLDAMKDPVWVDALQRFIDRPDVLREIQPVYAETFEHARKPIKPSRNPKREIFGATLYNTKLAAGSADVELRHFNSQAKKTWLALLQKAKTMLEEDYEAVKGMVPLFDWDADKDGGLEEQEHFRALLRVRKRSVELMEQQLRKAVKLAKVVAEQASK
ncbi:hypothetical protein BAUCODRAFT_28037 [Baudoinia panamericana UAMH 10762]|uniref:Uncharacterized protein n=1 Tax=Baudoinia panamericana (strain UAMH 10762) TaxID=717646 RepID=M2MZL8_BAUPA|nr:uncharacterized protein BAUCODRAFT_28037 [Baudoinia panamericana UAMH 10762]EMC91785.1 hypothetical protein BAUCODRAFT_28037 [Baudoinia panamericana UAMH 10762]